jgi:hypothetical protein
MKSSFFYAPKLPFWQSMASVDLRSLVVLRLLLSVTILINIYSYWPYADVFFAPQTGWLLREEAMRRHPAHWSILYAFDYMPFLHVFFCAYLLAALALLFGYKTRLATLLCWIGTVSLKNRGIQFTNFGDVLHCILLFWGMFLPLGARFSIDAALNKHIPSSTRYATIASFALLVSMASLYLFGALYKTGYNWKNFTAVYYALSAVELSTPFSQYLLQLDWLLKPLTAYVHYVEFLAPFLLFLPFYTEYGRLLGVPLIFSLHIGFAIFLSVNIFSIVALAGASAFIPTVFWDRVLARVNSRKTRQNIHIFYDKGCDFCLKLCLIFKSLSLPTTTPVTPAQDDAIAGPILEKTNSWVVRSHDGTYLTHWNAVSYLWRRSPLLWPLGALFFVPGFRNIGHRLYLLIAQHRPQLAQLTARYLPYNDTALYYPTRPAQLLILVLFGLSFLQDVRSVTTGGRYATPGVDRILIASELKHKWIMYAPYAKHTGEWFVIEGKTTEGLSVDLLRTRDTPPSHARPPHSWEMHSHAHLLRYITLARWQRQGERVTHYFCRNFFRAYPDIRVERTTVYRYQQITAPPGEPPEKISSLKVYEGYCPGAAPRPNRKKSG